jgi:hypothetical protein
MLIKYFENQNLTIFYVSTATFFLLHCDEWDRVVALPRHKIVTGATLLQLGVTQTRAGAIHMKFSMTGKEKKRPFNTVGCLIEVTP